MLRSSLLPRALARVTAAVLGGLVLGVAPVTAAAHAAAAAPTDPTEPLTLTMHSITPDYIPDHGKIEIQGTITNSSQEEWTAINVHAFIGSTPISTPTELAQAAQTPVANDVGGRITVPGTFDHIDSLQPGESVPFTVDLPRSTLPVSAPGVYWFGVHALGSTAEGTSQNAVGRDRTFLPLVPSKGIGKPPVDTALVLPIRADVTRGPDGSIENPTAWLQDLQSGPLHSLVELGKAAGGQPLTWLVDPAVLDAVRQLAHGNPARSLGSAPAPGSTSPSPSPTTTTGVAGSSAPNLSLGTALTSAVARHPARVWLRQLHHLLASPGSQILGLPYGDLAVSSASQYDQPLLRAALAHTGATLKPWGLPMGSVVAPPEGRVSATELSSLPRTTQVLLPDSGVTGTAPTVSKIGGRTLVLSSAGAASGGPGPDDPLGALALRQRILCEAALRYLGDGSPLVVQLPQQWHHLATSGFFQGLDVPWLHLTTLGTAASGAPPRLDTARLRTPSTTLPQLDPELYAVANLAVAQSQILQSVLPGNKTLADQIFEETASNASYTAAADPYGALARVRNTEHWVSMNLAGIHLQAPESVTLASANGRFSALISNDLDVPVNVQVGVQADPRLRITGGDTIALPPHGRTTVLLNASTHVLGVHTVTLQLTNKAGTPLGSSDQFPMRAEQVSQLIWVIIGAGVGLLFAAIVVRLVRRFMRSRA